MPALKNQRHELFVQGLVAGKTDEQAAIDAGYSEKTASKNTPRLKRNEGIKARYAELMGKAAERTVVTREWIIEQIVNAHESAMTPQPVLDRYGKPTGATTKKEQVSVRAMELLARMDGHIVDRAKVEHKGNPWGEVLSLVDGKSRGLPKEGYKLDDPTPEDDPGDDAETVH